MNRWKLAALLSLLLVVASLGEAPHPAIAATSRVWTGAVNLNWNTAGNWSPSGVPVDGDSVLIGAPADGKTLNNDRPGGLNLASLAVTSSFVVLKGNPLSISNSIQVGTAQAAVTLDLQITLTANTQVISATGSRLFMRERLSPSGTIALNMAGRTLTKTGPGEIEFDGDLVGSGTFAVQSGTFSALYPLTFGGTISLGSGSRALLTVLGNGTGFCGSAANADFVLSSAELSVACVVSIRSVSGTGDIEMFSEDSRLFIAGSQSRAEFNGPITGTAPSTISCCSNGSQTLRGTSTFTGNILVESGALYFDGAKFPAASSITAQGQGQLRPALVGYGTFGETILTNAILALDSIGGQFGLARFPGLQFAPDVIVDMEFKGPAAGVGFTQILMNGQIVLDSASLRLNFGSYAPPAGQTLTLVKGATALLDTFHNFYGGGNLGEGATFTVPGPPNDPANANLKFSITYKGGGGHDVVITRLAGSPPPPTTYTRILPMITRD